MHEFRVQYRDGKVRVVQATLSADAQTEARRQDRREGRFGAVIDRVDLVATRRVS